MDMESQETTSTFACENKLVSAPPQARIISLNKRLNTVLVKQICYSVMNIIKYVFTIAFWQPALVKSNVNDRSCFDEVYQGL